MKKTVQIFPENVEAEQRLKAEIKIGRLSCPQDGGLRRAFSIFLEDSIPLGGLLQVFRRLSLARKVGGIILG